MTSHFDVPTPRKMEISNATPIPSLKGILNGACSKGNSVLTSEWELAPPWPLKQLTVQTAKTIDLGTPVSESPQGNILPTDKFLGFGSGVGKPFIFGNKFPSSQAVPHVANRRPRTFDRASLVSAPCDTQISYGESKLQVSSNVPKSIEQLHKTSVEEWRQA